MDEEQIDLKPKRLYKSSSDRVIFGVCGGIADYYGIDPTWIRLVFVFLTIAGGSGLLIYLILAILMPKNPEQKETITEKVANERFNKITTIADKLLLDKRRNVVGLVIIVLGALAFFQNSLPLYWIDWDILWPIIIVLIGFSIIRKK